MQSVKAPTMTFYKELVASTSHDVLGMTLGVDENQMAGLL